MEGIDSSKHGQIQAQVVSSYAHDRTSLNPNDIPISEFRLILRTPPLTGGARLLWRQQLSTSGPAQKRSKP
jgi:hypothetical protein